MEIIVCVKQVPGTSQVEVDPETGVLKRAGVAGKLNPYDLFALEAAFTLTAEQGGSVRTLTMGPPQAREALLETIWMGAREGWLLTDRVFGGADVAATSTALALGIRQMGGFDLILCGKQTTDGDTAQVGPELAEKLHIEHVTNVTRILSADRDSVTVVMDLDSCLQTVRLSLPCLIMVDKDLNTPRLPSLKKKKTLDGDAMIHTVTAKDIPGLDETKLGLKGSPTQVERIFAPDKNQAKVLVQGDSRELTERLYGVLTEKKFI